MGGSEWVRVMMGESMDQMCVTSSVEMSDPEAHDADYEVNGEVSIEVTVK
jgi:hypothetical protein